jgi:hypothetical protein
MHVASCHTGSLSQTEAGTCLFAAVRKSLIQGIGPQHPRSQAPKLCWQSAAPFEGALSLRSKLQAPTTEQATAFPVRQVTITHQLAGPVAAHSTAGAPVRSCIAHIADLLLSIKHINMSPATHMASVVAAADHCRSLSSS